MTSRAGPTILERILDGREPLLDLMSEYRAAIEQEVRDDIRARLGNPYEWNPGYCPWCDKTMLTEGHAADCLFAAISSSSATETPIANPYAGHDGSDEPVSGMGLSSATETQDGERTEGFIEVYERGGDIANAARRIAGLPPTPDDRDREVERITAVLEAAPYSILVIGSETSAAKEAAAALFDAGLRASGGD